MTPKSPLLVCIFVAVFVTTVTATVIQREEFRPQKEQESRRNLDEITRPQKEQESRRHLNEISRPQKEQESRRALDEITGPQKEQESKFGIGDTSNLRGSNNMQMR